MIKKPKGTNDILPSESYIWHWVENKLRNLAARFCYHEIRTPIFESTDLFIRGVGEGTDIVEKEMYTFRDKGDRSITLRPEGTASAVRAYLEHSINRTDERFKIYYIGPMFRYERPQAGRFRQHTQFGLELYGEQSYWGDVEVFSFISAMCKELGLANITVKLNSIGCTCRNDYIEALKSYLRTNLENLCSDCSRRFEKNPLRILDCKKESCRKILKESPVPLSFLCQDCSTHFEGVKSGLEAMGIRYEVDSFLVRGLDYYTKTVFEVVSTTLGSQNAILGGGRYNNLIKELGGPEIPAVGFSSGMERLILTLQNEGVSIPDDESTELRIACMGEKAAAKGFTLMNELRDKGIRADMDFRNRKLKKQLKTAANRGEPFVMILGEDELEQGKVKLKDMINSQEHELSLTDTDKIKSIIRSSNA